MTMTGGELNLLHGEINSCKHYLEFGAGDSTIYAAGVPSVESIDSIESSPQYVSDHLLNNNLIHNAMERGVLTFHTIDIGETVEWGCPKDSSKRHLWPNYSMSVFTKESEHDLAFVDGRFRVACVLNSILNTPPECKILIHDFWNRPQYHVLLDFLNVEERADTMGLFSKREREVDEERIQILIEEYQYIWE